MIHDTSAGGHDYETRAMISINVQSCTGRPSTLFIKLTDEANVTGRQQVVDPLFEFGNFDVEAGRDDTALVEATVQLDNNLSGSVVIDKFEFTNVTYSNITLSVMLPETRFNHCIRHTYIFLFNAWMYRCLEFCQNIKFG